MIDLSSSNTVVFKYGGSALGDPENVLQFVHVVADAIQKGVQCVIVHGGGAEIDRWLMRLEIEKRVIGGLRVTDEATMEIVEMVLSGKANKALVGLFEANHVSAVGLSGRDGSLLTAKVLSPQHGRVGKIISVQTKVIEKLLPEFLPIIATVASDEYGQALNVNADLGASAIASALHADQLILLTDTDGVRRDPADPASTIDQLSIAEAQELILTGVADRGMIPKLEAAIDAVQNGVKKVLILNAGIWNKVEPQSEVARKRFTIVC